MNQFFLKFCCVLLLFVVAECGKDYYEALGISKTATEKEIKRAYKQLSLKLHPDKNKDDPDTQTKFIEVTNAYETLIDEGKRRIYDQYGEEGLSRGNQQQHFTNPFDIFSNFHSHNTGGMRQGANVELDLDVSLRDLYEGRQYDFVYRKQTLCSVCRGSGAKNSDDVKTCPVCKGTGVRTKVQQFGMMTMQSQETCDQCGGKGRVVKSTCPHCSGKKVEIGEENLLLVIERGMTDGQTIVFAGEADEAPDTNSGDLIFKIVTAPDDLFSRKGDDLYCKVSITLLEALVGFNKQIKHLDQHIVVLATDKVTPPGFVMAIPEEGMPHHNYPSQMGVLYVTFEIIFPTSISAEQKDGFKLLLKH